MLPLVRDGTPLVRVTLDVLARRTVGYRASVVGAGKRRALDNLLPVLSPTKPVVESRRHCACGLCVVRVCVSCVCARGRKKTSAGGAWKSLTTTTTTTTLRRVPKRKGWGDVRLLPLVVMRVVQTAEVGLRAKKSRAGRSVAGAKTKTRVDLSSMEYKLGFLTTSEAQKFHRKQKNFPTVCDGA